MQITLIQVGKTKEQFIKMGEEFYLERLKGIFKIEFKNIEASYISSQKLSEAQVDKIKQEEAERILEKIGKDEFVVVLDERGKLKTSVEFAEWLEGLKMNYSKVTFVIGGPFGQGEAIKKRANLLLSFSKFTFTHEMIRILLLEQIFRAVKIIAGSKYHY